MHKERILPWQNKGRWYHAFIESDGTTPKLTVCDLDATVSGTTLILPKDFHVIDYKVTSLDLAKSKTLAYNVCKTNSDTKEVIVIPAVGDFTYMDIQIFGIFN